LLLPLPLTLSCREIVVRRPHEFKIACLQDIRALFPAEWNPFYAAFGNRDTDEVAYRCAHCRTNTTSTCAYMHAWMHVWAMQPSWQHTPAWHGPDALVSSCSCAAPDINASSTCVYPWLCLSSVCVDTGANPIEQARHHDA
jgi:hypothetical protein